MDRYAIINTQTNLVENLIIWDGQTPWQGPENFICIKINESDADIGSTYDPVSQTFTPPPKEVDSIPGTEPAVIG